MYLSYDRLAEFYSLCKNGDINGIAKFIGDDDINVEIKLDNWLRMIYINTAIVANNFKSILYILDRGAIIHRCLRTYHVDFDSGSEVLCFIAKYLLCKRKLDKHDHYIDCLSYQKTLLIYGSGLDGATSPYIELSSSYEPEI
jgi:hypothetical protein